MYSDTPPCHQCAQSQQLDKDNSGSGPGQIFTLFIATLEWGPFARFVVLPGASETNRSNNFRINGWQLVYYPPFCAHGTQFMAIIRDYDSNYNLPALTLSGANERTLWWPREKVIKRGKTHASLNRVSSVDQPTEVVCPEPLKSP